MEKTLRKKTQCQLQRNCGSIAQVALVHGQDTRLHSLLCPDEALIEAISGPQTKHSNYVDEGEAKCAQSDEFDVEQPSSEDKENCEIEVAQPNVLSRIGNVMKRMGTKETKVHTISGVDKPPSVQIR